MSNVMQLLRALPTLAFVVSFALGMLGASWPRAAAEPLPDRPIRFVVGFGAGGATDILARALAEQLSTSLGRKVIVENRTGASGNIATQAVAAAEPDGLTYLIGASPMAVNHSLFPDFPVKYGRDLAAVAALGATGNVLVVHPSLNVRTLAQFTEYVRARPGAVSYATVGVGSSSHLAGVAFERGRCRHPRPKCGNSGGRRRESVCPAAPLGCGEDRGRRRRRLVTMSSPQAPRC